MMRDYSYMPNPNLKDSAGTGRVFSDYPVPWNWLATYYDEINY